jgi:hypothetical protein
MPRRGPEAGVLRVYYDFHGSGRTLNLFISVLQSQIINDIMHGMGISLKEITSLLWILWRSPCR